MAGDASARPFGCKRRASPRGDAVTRANVGWGSAEARKRATAGSRLQATRTLPGPPARRSVRATATSRTGRVR